MGVYKCKMCGGSLNLINEENGLCECDSCGSTQTIPLQNNLKKTELYNTANEYRKNNRFDRAADVYKNMIQEFPEEAEAYWGMVLCRYGIEYVKDPGTGKMMPTCHRTIPKSIFEDSDYRLACEKAKPLAREQHEKEAEKIDQIQKKIFALANKEEPYDIFISYKELEEGTRQRTEDSVLAQDIYNRFTSEGYKVFFSRISLENRLGEDYEPIIYSALRSSKVMLLVGTSKEHLNAPWVRNEWSRYLDMMDEEPDKKTLIPVYSKMNPYDIPSEISGRHLQAQDAGKIGFQQDLLHGVKKVLKSSHTNVAPMSGGGISSANTGGMLERGFICLKDRNFQEAENVFNRVLDIDPHSGGAYLGRLMIQRNVSTVEELENQTDPMYAESDYQHAVEYGEPQIKKTLREYEKKIIAENRKKALRFIQEKQVDFSLSAKVMRENIVSNQKEINQLSEAVAERKKLVEKNEQAESAMKLAKYIILALHVLFWLPNTITSLAGGEIGTCIIGIVVAVLIWKFILEKFLVAFIQKIVGKAKGKIDEQALSQVVLEINSAQQVIGEKTNTIAYIQNAVGEMEEKMEQLKNDRENLADKLSRIAYRNMADEFERIVG